MPYPVGIAARSGGQSFAALSVCGYVSRLSVYGLTRLAVCPWAMFLVLRLVPLTEKVDELRRGRAVFTLGLVAQSLPDPFRNSAKQIVSAFFFHA